MTPPRRHGRSRASKPSPSRRHRSYEIVCAGCGKRVVVPVPPPEDKELLCLECFKK